MTTSYGERLSQALEAAGKSRQELAAVLRSPDASLGVSVSAVGQVINGATKSLTAENSALAAKFLGVNHFWLATGLGPMKEQAQVVPFVASEPQAGWAAPEQQVLQQLQILLGRVDPVLRPAMADLLAAWAKDGGKGDRAEAISRLLGPSQKQPQAGKVAAR